MCSGSIDLVVTDPPYFDSVQYGELSALLLVWAEAVTGKKRRWLTFDGYVVDGNRRLAALREAKEQYAEAVVLPEDAQAREIYETEIELQMQRETKAPYDWVDQAVHIEYGITKLGESHEVIARRMRMSKPDILEELQKL